MGISSKIEIKDKTTKSGKKDRNKMAFESRLVPLTLRDDFWNDSFFSRNWMDFETMAKDMMMDVSPFLAPISTGKGHCSGCNCSKVSEVSIRPPMRRLLKMF